MKRPRIIYKVFSIFVLLSYPLYSQAGPISNGGFESEMRDLHKENEKKYSRFHNIDLKISKWYVTEGFQNSFRYGLDPDKNGVRPAEIPIVMNSFFNIPSSISTNHFTLSTSFHLKTEDLARPLALKMAWLGENWAIYLNGHLMKDEIYLNDKGQIIQYRTLKNFKIPIDNEFLLEGNNQLVFHIVGNAPPTPLSSNDNVGLLYQSPYEIISGDNEDFTMSAYFDFGLSTVYLFFGLYHLLIFSKRRQEIYNLFFAGLSLLLSIYIFPKTLLYDTIRDTSYLIKAHYASQPMIIPLFHLFIHYYYNQDRPRFILLDVYAVFGLAISLFMLIAPFNYAETGLFLMYISFLPMLVHAAITIAQLIFSNKTDVALIIGSITFTLLIAVFEILDSMYIQTGIRFVKFAFFGVVMSMVASMANRFLRVHNESERLNVELTDQKNAFYRFVPTQFLQLMGKDTAVEISLGDSSNRTMSVLMSDIRQFTNISERMTPEETFQFLNTYLARMEPAIQRYAGFVDKYIGDAILALFSDEKSMADLSGDWTSADRAVHAALDMRREQVSYNDYRKKDGMPPIDFGVGINTGPLVIGTVGSSRRLETTVIGNTVNLAARVESLNTIYKSSVIITDGTYKELSSRDKLLLREIDSVLVKGKSEPHVIYEVFETDPQEMKDKKLETLDTIAMAIIQYKLRNFDEALNLFKYAYSIFPNDPVTNIYINRCENYLAAPPPEDWNGVFEMLTK